MEIIKQSKTEEGQVAILNLMFRVKFIVKVTVKQGLEVI